LNKIESKFSSFALSSVAWLAAAHYPAKTACHAEITTTSSASLLVEAAQAWEKTGGETEKKQPIAATRSAPEERPSDGELLSLKFVEQLLWFPIRGRGAHR
jgi:hypothetical protein